MQSGMFWEAKFTCLSIAWQAGSSLGSGSSSAGTLVMTISCSIIYHRTLVYIPYYMKIQILVCLEAFSRLIYLYIFAIPTSKF